MPLRIVHATACLPGAIAIVQPHGDALAALRDLTGVTDWPLGRVRLVDFAGIDRGLAVRLTAEIAQLMPHGGPRVIQRLTAKLIELGAQVSDADSIDPCDVYPEAQDQVEALMLSALARAESPLALDLLLDQPRRWRSFLARAEPLNEEDVARSARLNRLIDPPIVVLAGRPNVGKSTLSNALLGRSMSIALDLPGTTRDYTAGRIDLGGLVVDWHDTPGLRTTKDPIEREAMRIAAMLVEGADLLIAMRDPESDWPELPRAPDLRVLNKIDLAAQVPPPGGCIAISARAGTGVAELVTAVRAALVPEGDVQSQRPWLFDPRLGA